MYDKTVLAMLVKELRMVKSQAYTAVFSFTASIPNTQVIPSSGRRVRVTFTVLLFVTRINGCLYFWVHMLFPYYSLHYIKIASSLSSETTMATYVILPHFHIKNGSTSCYRTVPCLYTIHSYYETLKCDFHVSGRFIRWFSLEHCF